MSNQVIKANDRKEKIMAYLTGEEKTKGDHKSSGIETLKAVLGGLLGGAAGAFIGKPSLGISIPTIYAGKFLQSSLLSAFGTGMLTSSSYKAVKGINGTEVGALEGLEGAKERLKSFGEELKERLYLDKIKSIIAKGKTKNSTEVNGLDGKVTYFNPNNELDMGSLDAIEEEIQRHAEQFQQKQFAGNDDYFGGNESNIIY